MTFQLRISKEGYNALTETDPRNYIFDATRNHPKTLAGGTINKSLGPNGQSVEAVAHGLGYKPSVFAYYSVSDNPSRWSICTNDKAIRTALGGAAGVLVDDDYVYFRLRNYSGSSSRTITVAYEITYEGSN